MVDILSVRKFVDRYGNKNFKKLMDTILESVKKDNIVQYIKDNMLKDSKFTVGSIQVLDFKDIKKNSKFKNEIYETMSVDVQFSINENKLNVRIKEIYLSDEIMPDIVLDKYNEALKSGNVVKAINYLENK